MYSAKIFNQLKTDPSRSAYEAREVLQFSGKYQGGKALRRIIFTAILVLAFSFAAFAQVNENPCPAIEIITPNEPLGIGKPVNVFVRLNGKIEETVFSYEWTTSAGEILRGQGKSEIEFVIREPDTSNVNVTVRIIGLAKNCSSEASDVMPVTPTLHIDPVDRFGKLTLDDYKARLDNFLVSVQSDPVSEGLIIIRFDTTDNRGYKTSLLRNILEFLEWRKSDLTRITFAISETDEKEKTVLWIVPPGAEFPKEDEDNKIIKGEELGAKINELFPKK